MVLMAHLAGPKYNSGSKITCADRVIVKHMYSRKPSSVQNVLIDRDLFSLLLSKCYILL